MLSKLPLSFGSEWDYLAPPNPIRSSAGDEFNTLELTVVNMSLAARFIAHPSACDFKNSKKNRYPDVLALESTLVKLSNGDYINANHVLDHIATQGPLPHTMIDFWQMTHEQNSNVIVALAKVGQGAGTIDCYWPTDPTAPRAFSDITVSFLRTMSFAEYTVNILQLTKNNIDRKIYHLHYHTWPDQGVPSSTKNMVLFVQLAAHLASRPSNPGPMIVHCSAGIGRTGVFLAIDHLLKHPTDRVIDTVKKMRDCRDGMVQKAVQYQFIHDCIANKPASPKPHKLANSVESVPILPPRSPLSCSIGSIIDFKKLTIAQHTH